MSPTTAEILQALRTQREAEAVMARVEEAVLRAHRAGDRAVPLCDLAQAIGLVEAGPRRTLHQRLDDLADALGGSGRSGIRLPDRVTPFDDPPEVSDLDRDVSFAPRPAERPAAWTRVS